MSTNKGADSPGRSGSDVGGAQGAICVKNRGGRFFCFSSLILSSFNSKCSAVIFTAKLNHMTLSLSHMTRDSH